MNLARVLAEGSTEDTQVLRRLEHQLARLTLGDLDVTLEDRGVAEAELQRGNGHRLRDRAEVKHTLLTQASQVKQAVFNMFQSVQHHLGAAVQCSFAVLGLEQIIELLDVLGPNLFGPEATSIIVVLSDVSDDVCLLEEESHGLVQTRAFQQGRVTKLGLDEEARQSFTNQAGDVVAVQVVFLDGDHAGVIEGRLATVIGHTVAHLVSDVLDDGLVGGLHLLELGDDIVKLNQQLTVLLFGAVAIKRPAILFQEVLEATQQGFLCFQRNRRVIFDGVQPAKCEVEDADGHQQLRVELLDDGAEAPTGQVEEFEAGLLSLGFVLLIALMNRGVPDLPMTTGKAFVSVGTTH